MLRSLDEIRGYTLRATDGEIGRAKDFLFDDRRWTIRYLVADTGKWLPKQKVLLSPIFFDEPEWEVQQIPVVLSKQMIEKSPALDEHAPVSRQAELDYYEYFRYPPYWFGSRAWGMYPTPAAYRAASAHSDSKATSDSSQNDSKDAHPNLRSVQEVIGYHVAAENDDAGNVADFIVDTSTWSVRWLVVDTGSWLSGRKVLVAPAWMARVSWAEKELQATITNAQIENSPPFDPSEPVNATYESQLYDYYGRPLQPV